MAYSISVDPDVEFWSPEPILAFRVWWWQFGKLRGQVSGEWTSHSMDAECRRVIEAEDCGIPPPHLPRQQRMCAGRCGIYAFKTTDALIYEMVKVPWWKTWRLPDVVEELPDTLFGAVRLTGRVVEAKDGYRAQHAEVIGVVRPESGQVWSTGDRDAVAAVFADPTPESHYPSWSCRPLKQPAEVAIAVMQELERIAHEHR